MFIFNSLVGISQPGLQAVPLLENRGISFSLTAIAGLLDGLNPCAIGMLVLLLGYILVFAHQPKRMIKNGIAYILTVFISYFLIGALLSHSLYSLLNWPYYQEISQVIKYLIIAALGLAALVNIKDFFWYGKWFSLGVTKDEAIFLLKYVRKLDWTATIVLALLVVIFELPCSLPLYLGSISVLTQAFSYWQTMLYLLVYCFMFVVPLIIIFAVLVETKQIYELKEQQEKYNRWMKLLMGIAQAVMVVVLILLSS